MIETLGVVGLGSMGKRRVRDLLAEGRRVIGFDIRPDRNAEARARFGIPVVDSFDALVEAGAEAIVVATPPDAHVACYQACFDARRPFFSEASIFTPRAAWFAEREARASIRSWPSATWQFHPLVASLRGAVQQIGAHRVNSVSHQYAGYLPAWHPWEPYTAFYAGQPKTSAAREMVPFEAEMLLWILGRVRTVSAVQARRGEWLTAIDDTYLVLLEFETGVQGSMSVELHQVDPFRFVRVAGRDRGLTLDLKQHTLREKRLDSEAETLTAAPGVLAPGAFAFEDVYRAEMRAFLGALDGTGRYEKTWSDDRHLSCILAAAEESWRRRGWVTIEEAESLHDGLNC